MPRQIQIKMVYNPREVAEICRVDPNTVGEWIAAKRLPMIVVPGEHYRFRHCDLGEFMDENGMEKPPHWDGEPSRFRVLVIEDDPDLLDIIGDLLREEPRVEVKRENDSFTAGLQISGWQPDLILLDFLMPGISGFEICSKLRANPLTRDIPVIAMTSLSTESSRQAVFDSGISDFLGKPFRGEELLHRVRLMLGLTAEAFKPRPAPPDSLE